MRRLRTSMLLTCLCSALAFSAAQGEVVFSAVLSGANEVPPNASPGVGTAVLTLNDAQTEVSFHIEFSGLLGTETAAHFHNAPPGTNGSVVFGLPLGSPKDGVWAVGPAEVAMLMAEEVYVNVHTTSFPGGEIRGNLAIESTATASSTLSAIRALY